MAVLLGCTSLLALAVRANAQTVLPQGGTVASGQVRIGTPAGNTLTINQSSSRAVVDWNSFSVGPNASVNFVQPNAGAAILNRVTGTTSSTIAGQITATGQVFLVNPNGIAITPSGSVQVGGGFVASTLDISNADFNAGNLSFSGKGASAAVSNAGQISGAGGSFVGLIGGSVSNSGTISVPFGRVGLGAGEKVTLNPSGDGFLQVALPTGATASDGRALIDVTGRVRAAGGTVEIKAATAQQAVRDVVNISGSVSARSVSGRSGHIVLDGGGGEVTISGTLAANGGTRNKGGTVVVTGNRVVLTPTATVTADGSSGGAVLIGGDLRGGIDPSTRLVQTQLRTAATTSIAQGARISANGSSGDGGSVVVWSDAQTDFRGSITASGGSAGNGGAVEVSSHGVLGFDGSVDVTARSGRTGSLLLDPFDVTISSGSDTNISNGGNTFTPTGNSSILSVTSLQAALATANVTVSTGAGGAQNGDITVANAVTWSSGNSLTLSAAGAIAINAPITASAGGLTLSAGSPAAAITVTGAINVASLTISQGAWSQNTANLPGLYAGSFSIASNASFLRAAGGSGTAGSPYLLTDIYGVQGIGSSAAYLANSYKLINDVDASTTTAWNGGLGFNPIGSNSFFAGGYTGTFDGNNYAISNLFINRGATGTGVGMFGYANGATIQNVDLLNANVTGGSGGAAGNGSGTLVGIGDNSTLIQNVSVTGTMTGSNAAGNNFNVGGIVGELSNNSTLTNSSAAVNVTSAIGSVGGAVGSVDSGSTVQQVSATGSVSGPSNVGGLAGWVAATITDSYATGAVSGGSSVGGFAGVTFVGSISNSYSTGLVTGGNGFIGTTLFFGTFTNDYWNTQTSGQGSGGAAGTAGLTTAQMLVQASFTGFDFSGTWYQTAGYYPTLRGTTTILGAAPGATGGDLTISSAADTVLTSATTTTNINTTSLQNLLGVGNVLVSTTSGTLAVNNDVTWGNSFLRLASSGALTIAANLTSGSSGNLGLTSSAISVIGSSINLGGALTATATASGSNTGVSLSNATISVGSGASTISGTSPNGHGVDVSGTTSLSASGGSLSVSGTSQAPSVAFGAGIHLASNAALSTSGAVTLAGTGGTTGFGHGVALESGATITSSGALTMQGTTNTSANNAYGIYFAANNSVTANSGTVSLTGTAATSGAGINQNSGTLTLTNNGAGAFSAAGTSSSYIGFKFASGTGITTTGTISLSGTSGSLVGLQLAGGNALTVSSGNLTMNGTATSDSGLQLRGTDTLTNSGAGLLALVGSSNTSRGAEIFSSANVTFAGNVSLSGTSVSGTGMIFNNASATTVTGGNLTVNGVSTSTSGTGSTLGTRFATASLVNSGSGAVIVTGTSDDTGAVNSGSAGVLVTGASALTNSGSGTLSVSGVNTSGYGLQLKTGAALTTSGTMSIGGTTGAGYGVLASSASITSTGALTVNGTSSSLIGTLLNGGVTLTASSGDLTVNGTSSTSNAGLQLRGTDTITNSGAGLLSLNGSSSTYRGVDVFTGANLTISGNTSLSGTAATGLGVMFGTSSVTSVTAGNFIVDGLSSSTTGTTGTIGTLFSDASLTNSGSGAVNVTGTSQDAAGTANSGSAGVLLLGTNSLTNSGSGTFSISGLNTSGYGAQIKSSATLATSGTLSIAGTSNTGYGFYLGGTNTVTASSGNLTLSGSSTANLGMELLGTSSVTNNGSGTLALNATGGADLQASLSSSNGNLKLSGTGALSQAAGTITAGNLLLSGPSGTFSLGQANLVGTIAANVGSVSFVNNQNLTIGTVQATSGVTASGTATLQASGNLTIASGAPVSATNPVLSATGAFINNAGSSAVTASSGRWLIYSSAPGSDTFGGLDSGNTAIWNATLATLPPGSISASGNRYLFANQPTLTFTSTNATKTYGTDATAGIASNYGVSGYQSGVSNAFVGDDATSTYTGSPSVTSTGAAAIASVAGGPYAMTVAQGTVTAISGYVLAFNSLGTLTVNPAPVTVTALGGSSTYGSSPSNPGLSATGLQNGQGVNVLTGLSNSFGIANTTNAGSYVLSVIGTLTNSNYTLAGTNNGSWTVNPAPVTVTALGGSSSYGSSPANPGLSATGLQNGQGVNVLTGLSNSFGIANTTNAGSYVLSVIGTLTNGNYTLAGTNNGSWTVNPAPVTVTALGGSSTYGASPANPGLSATGLQNGQGVNVLTGLSNSFGIANTTNAGSYVLSVIGTLTNGNYTLVGTNNGGWTVNPAPVTVTALGGSSTYGSSPSNPGLSATGLQNGQDVNVLTGLYNSFGISGASRIGSYVLNIAGTLTNSNYTVAAKVPGTWIVTDLRGSIPAGANPANGPPPSNEPSPSNPNLLVARPSANGGSGALNGLAGATQKVNIGSEPVATSQGGKGTAAGQGGRDPSANPSRAAGETGPSSPLASPPQPSLSFPASPAPVSVAPKTSANANAVTQGDCGGKAIGGGRTGPSGSNGEVSGNSSGGFAIGCAPQKAAGMIDFALEQLNRDALLEAIAREFAEVVQAKAAPHKVLMVSLAGASIALTAGLVGWFLRGGALLSALLSSMPLWRGFDPLMVVMRPRRSEGRAPSTSDVDAIFDGAHTARYSSRVTPP